MSSRALSPAIKLAKFLVFVINFVGLLFGIILISIGAYVYNSKSSIVASLAYSELDTGLIVLGIFVCLLSFVGAFGAKKEIAVLLKVYFALLCILVGIQIIVGLTAFASRAQTATVLNKGWDEAYQKNHLLILDVERSFECCGFTTTADRAVPATCVKETGRTNSCFDSMALSFDNYLHVIGVTGSVFGGMEILSLLLSFVLFKKIKQLAVDMHNDRLLEEAQKLEMSGKLSV